MENGVAEVQSPLKQSTGSLRTCILSIVLGWVTLMIGGGVGGALMYANLKIAPTLPIFLPITLIWLWLFWRYVSGHGWPRKTSNVRHEFLRGKSLSFNVWAWALLAGGLALTAVMGLIFVISHYATLPDAAYKAPFDVSNFSAFTKLSIFASLAATAAVVEEAAFRGYMLSGTQRTFGWIGGIATVTLLFYITHLSHAYATLSFLPFFIAHGVVFGLLVFYTRSILPGIVLHFVSDFIVLPMQYGAIPSLGQWSFVWQGWMSLIALAACIPAFWQLNRVMRIADNVQ